tara:strand:- start:876 stop:2081 length:1206 start_codon:yes stop_codon:yes gene_type:complete
MNLHEYQAKQLLAQHGVEVPGGEPCTTADEARSIAEKLFADGHEMVVMKIQIHSGGRGKGVFKDGFKGGVHLCKTAGEVHEKASTMLGNTIVTKQTGEVGRKVHTLLVASAEKIVSEFYLAVLLDRETSQPLIMVSREGGVDIEEVAETNPDAIVKLQVDPLLGLQPFQARNLAKALGLTGRLIHSGAKLIAGVYKTWWECDASMVEINPLCIVENPDGSQKVAAVDAKISIDGNSLYRHKDIAEMRDLNEEAELEVEASKFDLNYIKLDGNVACLVNGAGLAMSTMDAIKHYGGDPANFLDVGGGATKEQVTAAFQIILKDPNVKAILVNIFGGIMNCNTIAEGVVASAEETHLTLPLVVRLEGNNVEAGRKTLSESGISLITADSMADAAKKVVSEAAA